jgi:hypothetical protein
LREAELLARVANPRPDVAPEIRPHGPQDAKVDTIGLHTIVFMPSNLGERNPWSKPTDTPLATIC